MKYAVWIASGLLTLAFVGSAFAKLMGVPEVLVAFENLGLPSWFPAFVALCYIAGAVGLWIPKLAAPACVGFITAMVGAVIYHVALTPIGEAVPAAVLLGLSIFVFLRKKDQAFWA
ncbi:MAG: DoxX family protein [Pseudomonadota bacterium]